MIQLVEALGIILGYLAFCCLIAWLLKRFTRAGRR